MYTSVCLVGDSGSGKSTTLNYLAGEQIAPVANGTGSSTTLTPNTYEFFSPVLQRHMRVIDFPGFLDTRVVITDEEIRMTLKSIIADCLARQQLFAGFLVTVSLKNGSMRHMTTVNQIIQIFGEQVLDNCILLVTKYDNEVVPRKREWYPTMERECHARGLMRVMSWTNLPEQAPQNQNESLIFLLDSLPTFSSNVLNAVEQKVMEIAELLASQQVDASLEEILAEAQRLCADLGFIEQDIVRYNTVSEQQAYVTTETVTDRISDVEMVPGTENYVDYELRPETRYMELETTQVVGGNSGLFDTGLFAKKGQTVTVKQVQEYTVNVAHAVDRTRDVLRPQAIVRDVQRTQEAIQTREVDVQVPEMGRESRPLDPNLLQVSASENLAPRPADHFIEEAQKIVADQLRQHLSG